MILIFTESQVTSALKVYEILISRKIETILIDDLNKIKFSFLTLDNKNEQVSFIVLNNIINLKSVTYFIFDNNNRRFGFIFAL